MNKQERDQMIENNLPLVTTIAAKFVKSKSSRCFDDVFQTGCVGLIKAVDKFDSSLGFKFSTYAHRLIEGEIINNVNKKEKNEIDIIGLDDYANGYEGLTIQETLKDESSNEYKFIGQDFFDRLLKGLTKKQIQVIELRIGAGLSQSEASKIIGISKQGVSFLEREAIGKIRLAI
jgi:RNA polymerase sigma factor (sigma-70 family)